jgi:hypothetical protein
MNSFIPCNIFRAFITKRYFFPFIYSYPLTLPTPLFSHDTRIKKYFDIAQHLTAMGYLNLQMLYEAEFKRSKDFNESILYDCKVN